MKIQEFRDKIPQLRGLDDQSALNVLHQSYYPGVDKARMAEVLGVVAPAAPVEPTGFIRGAGDVALSLGQGAVGAVKSITDLAGSDNAVSSALGDANEALGGLKSDASKATMQNSMARVKAAEESGSTWEEAKAYMGMVYDQPLEMIAQGAGSFATMGIGKAAQALKLAQAAKAAGVSKAAFLASPAGQKAAQEAAEFGFKANIGVGAGMGVGAVKGSQYEQTYNNAKAQGLSEEEAAALATQAQEYGGAGTMQQMLGGVLGAAASATGPIERVIMGQGAREAGQGMAMSAARGFATEGVTEGAQGSQERYAGNAAAIAAGVLDPSQSMRGVVGQGLQEGVIGGVLGGGIGAIDSSSPATPQVPNVGPLSRAANTGLAITPPAPAPAPPVPLAPEQEQTLLAHANQRAQAIKVKAEGTKDQKVNAPDGTPVKIPGKQPEFLTPAEKEERDFLEQNGGDVHALATAYPGLMAAPTVEQVPPADPIQQTQALIDAGITQAAQDKATQRAEVPVAAPVVPREADPMQAQANDIVLANNHASISLVQRTLKIGYNRAARMVENMETAGLVSPAGKDGLRKVLKVEQVPPASAADLPKPTPEAFAQREEDRPAAQELALPMDGDILNTQGKPFTTMPGAMTAQKKAGDTHEIVRVAGGLVVRQKAANGTSPAITGLAQGANEPASNQPGASGQSALVQPERQSAGDVPAARITDAGTGSGDAVPLAGGVPGAVAPSGTSATAAPTKAKRAPKGPAGGKTSRSAAYDANPLMTFLATHGLFHDKTKPNSQKSEYSPDKAIMVRGYGPVFKKNGKHPSDLVAIAVQDGYLPKDGTVAQLEELIRRAVAGEKISPMYGEGVAEQIGAQRYEEHLAQQQEAAQDEDYDPFTSVEELGFTLDDAEFAGYDEAADPVKLEVNALLAQADALGIDTETIKLDAHYATENESEQAYYEAARSALQQAITTGSGDSSQDAGTPGSTGEQEGLTATTPEQIKADEERAAAAEKAARAQRAAQDLIDKKERERKDIAKASEAAADTFTLGGDAEQNLSGQQDVFGEPAPAGKPAASANTIFTEDAYQAARARLKAKLGTLNSGLDPETMLDGITTAGYHIEKGARSFAAYAKAMIADLGDNVKPYLKSWYMAAKFDPRAIGFDGMDGAAMVESADIDALIAADKKAPTTEAEGITKIIERIDGEDGMYVNIAASTASAGGFNVVLRDGDSEETVGSTNNVQTMEKAKAKANEMLGIKEDAPAPVTSAAPDIIEHVTAKGKVLKGVIRTDLSFSQAKAIDKFAFKKGDGYFIREAHLDALNAAHPQQTGATNLTLETTEGRHAIAQLVADELIGGTTFATIIEARKFIADKTGSEQAQPGTDLAKRADEAIELGVVLASREVVEAARKQGRTDETIFNRLVGIYKAQPSLNVRDSVSLRNQAYSTPVPLAFVASRLANITPSKKVGEPTAGNGALMLEANPKNATVNEIQDDRLEALRSQGFQATQKDATTTIFEAKSLDAMAMNPPFGPVNGQKWTFGDFTTGEIDHAIVMNSLKALKDDGDAVMIIGGTLARDDGERKTAYRGKSKREFFFTLYGQYNVVDHFTVSGDLYKKQGAAYPVDVLVIRGRGKSSRGLPAAQLPQLIDTWDQLKEKLNEASSVGTQGAGSTGRSDGANGNQPQPNGVPGPAAGAPGGLVGGLGSNGVGPGVRSAGGSGTAIQPTGPSGATGAPDTAGQRGNATAPAQPGDTGGAATSGSDQRQGSTGSTRSDQPAGVDNTSRVGIDKQAIADAANSGKLQVKYQNFSGNRSVNTLVSTNHLTAIENAFTNLRKRVGDIDEFVRAELQYEPEQFKKSFSAEQVEALALAIDNIGQGKGFIIGDQTGIGKGRVVAAMIRYAKLNGKTPVFVTQMPDLYGDMMRDLNDIGMGNTRPLMTNNNASVPLDAEALAWFGEKQGINARVTELLDEMGALAVEELGDKLTGMTAKERENAIEAAMKKSANPEMVSLHNEITELKKEMPERRGKFLDTPSIDVHEKALQKMVNSGSIGDHDVIFTTYNQMAALDSGKPKKNKETGVKSASKPAVYGYRSTFLDSFVNANSMLILDESHNAGEAGDGRFPKVGDVVRKLIAQSGGVFYSSATFAKNTAVMDVYSKTDLGSAFSNPSDLVNAINSVPMQQITSAMLVEAGQYLRRERSFDGIDYKTETVNVDQQAAEDVSTAMRLVVAFDKAKKAAISEMQNQLDQEGAVMAAVNGGGSQASVDSVNFTSVMHNVVNTFLLALKADAAAKSAIDAIRAGEKPVITVANTMEMFITEFSKDAGLGIGDKLNATFADVLKRYLQKTRKASIKHANGDTEVVELTDRQLGPDGVDAYNEAFDFIDDMDLDIPLSPIDHIKQRIEEAGFSIGEITGRQTVAVDGKLRSRNKAELNTAGKKNTIAKFNGGQLDALIINRSGSTGLSMHASETFADQRRRVMIVAQAELDINNHMQMLGRINRTGQVTTGPFDAGLNGTYQGRATQYGLPRYAQMTANVPIELRPAAVLSNKMAGLNANTTAGRKGAVQDQSALDFMNKYGDRVAAELVGGNPMLNERLGYPIRFDDNGAPFVPGAIAKVTGRIGLLPLADQTDLYGQLSTEYGDLITQLDALGQNDLEAKTYPLDAETIESKVVQKADKGTASPFTSSVVAEKVSMKKLGKPFPKAKVQELIAASLKGQDAMALRAKTLAAVEAQMDAERGTLIAARTGASAIEVASLDKQMDTLQAARVQFRKALPAIGLEIMLKMETGSMYGVVTSIERTGKAKSAGSLSAWKIKIAVVDGARSMTLPMTQIFFEGDVNVPANGIVMKRASEMTLPNAERTGFDTVSVMEAFDRGQTDARETRVIITGNILRGYGALRGRLLNYTDNKGGIKQGILMPPDFDMNAVQAKFTPVLKSANAVIDLLDRGGEVIDKTTTGETIRIIKAMGAYTISVSKTGLGKRLAKNGGVLNFVSAGNKMKVRVWDSDDLSDFLNKTVKPENISLIPSANSANLMNDDTDTAFSRGTSATQTALKALSENDELFALPKSDKDTVEGIAADVSPGITVKKLNYPGLAQTYVLTMPDGAKARMMVRKVNPYGPQAYGMIDRDDGNFEAITERPGDNAEDVSADVEDVYIDVSSLKEGGQGRLVYNIAATFTHNTGRILIGDPAGLSDVAMRRRTEHMLSSALKFGTTRHIAPHPRQVMGARDIGVPPMRWTYGDDLGNIKSLIETSTKSLDYAGATLFTFDPTNGTFRDSEGGVIDDDAISLVVSAGSGREGNAGDTTLKRNAVLSALLRESGQESRAGRPGVGILEKLVAWGREFPVASKGIFYSKGSGAGATGLSRQSVQDITNAITSRWGNAPRIIVAANMADPQIPQAVRDYDQKQKSLGATGEPEGFVHGGKVYLLADQLATPAEVMRVLFHESLGHMGLRGVFGDKLDGILKQLAGLRRSDVAAKAAQYGLDMSIEADRLHAAEEVLAELAQTKPELGYVQRAISLIRGWLRANVPGFGSMKLTDADIVAQFILPARRFIQGGGGPKGGKKAPQIGTSANLPSFSRSLGASLTAGMNNVRDVKLAAGYQVGDLFQGEGRLSYWHKSVGTMYNLAQRDSGFKKVFDSVQSFLNDTSFYAAESADLAPSILPKLDKATDALPKMTLFGKSVGQSPLSPADTKALSAPVFEGTLTWGRDSTGKAVPMEEIEAELALVPLDDRAHKMVKDRKLSPDVLKMWQGLEQSQYEAIINGKFEREYMRAGVVFTPAELKQHFAMTDAQVGLYQEFRAATDKSIDNLAISEMLNYAGKDVTDIRDQIIGMDDVDEAGQVLRDYLVSLVELEPGRDKVLSATAAKMLDLAAHAQDMKDRGYAPLSRFGNFTLEATLPTGERYFSLFETDRERNKMLRVLTTEGATDVQAGTMSQEAYKLLNGISPETAALFGEMLGLESQGSEAKDLAFQEFIKRGTANRSAMKRLLKRKGIAGFSEDSGRVLAGFIYSNARKTSSNLHSKETTSAIDAIPKQQGELKDVAVKLQDYVSSPQEEAQAFRGILFAQYLGGSVASAMVNATQPFTVTLPYLSQFGGVKKAAAQMAAAVRDAGKGNTGDVRLNDALKKAEEEGIVSPQEVHALQAQAAGRAQLQSGDGTAAGNTLAMASNGLSKLSLAWGKVFGLAEQFNRRTTFIAAYRTAVEQGITDPAAFASKAVTETQFVYNKGNKPRWARGVAGSILFTFKQYSVNYLELVTRMATAGEPGSAERKAGQKAALLAIAILFMMAGADGLPFVEDIEDVIDGAMQRLGYNFSSKQAMKSFLALQLGKDGAAFVMNGVSGVPGIPIDVSGRLGMGNLIPGTGMFQKKTDHTRDLMELAGPAGDFVKRGFAATEQLLTGDVTKAMGTISPVAARNVIKGIDMADTGMYRDDKGRKIIDTTGTEALLKGIGFQPRNVKEVQDASGEVQRAKAQYILASSEIRAKMAQAIFVNDNDLKQDARDDIATWNTNNPGQRMTLNMPAVLRRVREMRKSKEQRMTDTAPTAIRAQVRQQLKEELQ